MFANYKRTGAESLIELVCSRGNLSGSRLIIVDVKSTRNIETGFTPFEYCGCQVCQVY